MNWHRCMLGFAAAATLGAAAAQQSETDAIFQSLSAPALALWIESARDAAVTRGVEPIPADIRAVLSGYVADDILDRARWRVDDSVLSVQQSLFRMGATPAVTLDYVVLFQTSADATDDPALWAHELIHVRQYRDWGVDGFVARYLEDYEAVEHEAAEFRWQWMKATGRTPVP